MASKPVPRIVVILAVLFVLACGVVMVLYRSLDSVVRAAMEKEGPKITGTAVHVGGVHLELPKGRGEFHDLRLANPDGFSSGDAVRLGDIVLDLDTKHLGKEPIVVDELRVSGPSLHLELNARGASNLEAIRKSVQSYTPITGRDSKAANPKLIVRRLVFEGAHVSVDARALGGKESEWDLGEVTLTDLGGKDGIPADALAKVAIETLVREVTKKAATEELKSAAERSLGDKVGDALGGLLGGKKK